MQNNTWSSELKGGPLLARLFTEMTLKKEKNPEKRAFLEKARKALYSPTEQVNASKQEAVREKSDVASTSAARRRAMRGRSGLMSTIR